MRAIIAPFTEEVARLNDETAIIAALMQKTQLTNEESRQALQRRVEAQAALRRLEGQLVSSLHGQPSEIVNHGQIQDLRSSIASIRAHLEASGG